MNNRRTFFKQLAVSVAAIAAPSIFIPKLIEVPRWKSIKPYYNIIWHGEVSEFNRLPYYLAKMEIAKYKDSEAWHKLMEGVKWQPNLGNTLRAIS